MRLAGEFALQGLDRARFSNPRFAHYRNDLAFALPREVPAFTQQSHFVRTPDQRQDLTGPDGGKTAFHRRFALDPPGRHRTDEPLQFVFSGALELKQAPEQML